MDRSFFIEVACALIAVGLMLIAWDYLLCKTSEAYPLEKKSDEELARCTKEERKQYEYRKGNFKTFQSHEMRKGGYWVIGISVVLLVIFICSPAFSWSPDQDNTIFKFTDFIREKVQMPWGRINIGFAIGWLAIGGFCIAAGRHHWKSRRAYVQAIMCFILGAMLILEAIFQWQ